MSTYSTSRSDVFLQTFGKDVFSSRVRAFTPNGLVQIAGVMTAGVAAVVIAALVSFTPFGGEGAQAEQSVLDKSDRAVSALPNDCRNQAWGAWSADCAAAIAGTGSVRKINFVTVERAPVAPNTTVLARIPGNG
ncbi:hypothetical protein [Roseibium sp.]|uniref:hypothetical protein n=1 Tax=Roseibium sp. TaxID=1936156 RepID=UPI003A9786B4